MGTKLILTDIAGPSSPTGPSGLARGRSRPSMPHSTRVYTRGRRAGGATAGSRRFFRGDEGCCETCVATNGNQVFLDGRRLREARFDGDVLAAVVSHLRDIPGSGLIAFDGDVPTLVAGRLEDLAVVFPAYARACRTAPDGGPLGLPDFPATRANAFFAGTAGAPATTRRGRSWMASTRRWRGSTSTSPSRASPTSCARAGTRRAGSTALRTRWASRSTRSWCSATPATT